MVTASMRVVFDFVIGCFMLGDLIQLSSHTRLEALYPILSQTKLPFETLTPEAL